MIKQSREAGQNPTAFLINALDSGFRRNDVAEILNELLLRKI
ncbi:hypothetical protein [Ferrigenium sp. UT5]